MAPVPIFLSYAFEDAALAEELTKHLSPLVRSGEISIWHDGMIRAGESWRDVHEHELSSAKLVLFLVSADFLASDRVFEDLQTAFQHRESGTLLLPVLVRACDWTSSSYLSALQVIPRSHGPVASRSDRDEAWAEVVGEIQSVLRFGPEHVQPAAAGTPPPLRPIGDIFRTSGQPDITYVEPAQLKRLRSYLRMMGQGLVVEGPSGVGKTTVVRRALRDLGVAEHQWLFGQRDDDRQMLDGLVSHGFRGHLIIDDFHRLDRPRQVRVADAIKIIADRDARDAKITVIGINPVGDSLVSALGDVAGRFEVVEMGRQPDEKVSELIQKGEEAANITFRRREEFVLAAAGSFFTAQQLCYEAALKGGVDQTSPSRKMIDVGFRDVVDVVVKQLDSKYFSDLRAFACHDDRVPPRGATLALLRLITQSGEGHVALDDVRYRYSDDDVRDALDRLKSSYLSRCFDETPNLRSLFYYNKGAGVLSIEDPRLAFYLRHMSWPRFIERTGHKYARIDAEGNLVFSKRRPSDHPGAQEQFVQVLHLSDLHFSQLQQAEVWYGQLAEDLRELECERLDAVVLSGDLTQRADPKEFEAARRFILRLSTEQRLSPGQIVVVPGNHDLSWPLSKTAYSLRRREDHPGELREGTFIAHGTEVIEVRDDDAYPKRFSPFAAFYEQIKGAPYPLEFEAQLDVQDFPRENLLFVGLNSAWSIDHHFRDRAGINPEAFTRALDRIRQNRTYAGRLKIAVWHHPLASTGEDRIKDQGFLQQLAKAGVRLVLHGHVHRAERGLYRYDMSPDGRRIEVVAAGTFGAPSSEWIPGYPLQYNLLRISKTRVVVETRRREEPNGAWQPDARWLQGPGKDPVPRYEIKMVEPGEPQE